MTDPTDLNQVLADLAAIARIIDRATNAELANFDPAMVRLLTDHASALGAEVEQLRAENARLDTALIEATRDTRPDDDEPEDGEPTRAALIETIAAADADRDRLGAELARERAVVDEWIRASNDGEGSDVGDLMQALEQARVPQRHASAAQRHVIGADFGTAEPGTVITITTVDEHQRGQSEECACGWTPADWTQSWLTHHDDVRGDLDVTAQPLGLNLPAPDPALVLDGDQAAALLADLAAHPDPKPKGY